MSVNELREEGIDCTFIAVKLPYGVQKDADEVDQALRFIEPDEIVESILSLQLIKVCNH